MKQITQRVLGIKLAKSVGATETEAAIRNKEICFEDIFKTAVAESEEKGCRDLLVSKVLQGPPEWAYAMLRLVADLGFHRDALIRRAAEEPPWAFHTLRDVPDIGSYRETLLKKVVEDPAWAHMALREVSDLGSQRDALLRSVASDPDSARLALLQISDLGERRKEIETAAVESVAGRASMHSGSASG